MVAGAVGLVLSPAQRSLVEKSVAVRRAREEKAAIQRTLEDAARRHIGDTKARCRTTHHRAKDAAERDHSLIIRHVGEQLANVARRELLQDPHKFAKKALAAAKTAESAAAIAASVKAHPSSSGGSREDADYEYDEDRFGSVRRPPRVRPPNLWVSVRCALCVFIQSLCPQESLLC